MWNFLATVPDSNTPGEAGQRFGKPYFRSPLEQGFNFIELLLPCNLG